jgi:hypothetical protein
MQEEYYLYDEENIHKEILNLLESNYSVKECSAKSQTQSKEFEIRKWKNYEITAKVTLDRIVDFMILFTNTENNYVGKFSLKAGFLYESTKTRKRKLNKIKTLLNNMDKIQSIVDKAFLFDSFLDGLGIDVVFDENREFQIYCDSKMIIIGAYESLKVDIFEMRFNHAPGIKKIFIEYKNMLKIETSKQFFELIGVDNGE